MIRPLLLAVSSLALVAAADPGEPPLTPLTAMSGAPLDPATAKLRFDSADLSLEVFPEREAIAGVATLNFTAREATDRLVIDLDRNLPVSAIAINGRALAKGAWTNPEGRLTITLPKAVAANGKISAKITYGGTPHVAVRAPWDGGFVWSKTPAGQPWVATAVQGSGCDLFWPCVDYPTYEPDQITLHITVPKGLKAPSNGKLLGVDTLSDGRSRWNWRVEDPTNYGIALNIAPYEVVEGTYQSQYGNRIPMFYWHLPGEEQQAKALFAEFAPTLDFFETLIGPYPWYDEKVGVVETPHLGMEHQSINAYGNEYRKDATGFDWLFQHEFAHEWFANQLTAANWDDFWLHESFGAYMQPLYGWWREGDGRYTAMMLKQRETIANKFPIVSGGPRAAEDVYKPESGPAGDIYVKGSWMLHTLRHQIGDDDFFEATRRLVYGRPDPKPGNFEPRFSSAAEFRQIVNQVTGKDYGWFFDVYLNEAALPELVETRQGTTLTLEWKAPGGKPFPLPVEVAVDGKVQTVAMTGNRGTITVPARAHVVVDPMARILKQEDAIDAMQADKAARASAG